jgi:hypothetical protein
MIKNKDVYEKREINKISYMYLKEHENEFKNTESLFNQDI